jgi:hypothetical protein
MRDILLITRPLAALTLGSLLSLRGTAGLISGSLGRQLRLHEGGHLLSRQASGDHRVDHLG